MYHDNYTNRASIQIKAKDYWFINLFLSLLNLLPESCTGFRSEATKVLCLKES